VNDPMGFFEEITRYHIRQGIMPEEEIYPAPTLSALAAAYIAWQAGNEPDQLALLGIAEEGQIAAPKILTSSGD